MEVSLKDGFENLLKKLNETDTNTVPAGNEELEQSGFYFPKGTISLLLARPDNGKAFWGMKSALKNAQNGVKTLFISFELSTNDVLFRLNNQHHENMLISSMNISSIDHLVNTIRLLHDNHPFEIVYIDNLNLIGYDETLNEPKTKSEFQIVTLKLKELANELNASIAVSANLDSKLEERFDKRPLMSDIKDTNIDDIPFSQIIALYRDEIYNLDTEFPKTLEQIILKNRHGILQTVLTPWSIRL